MLDEAAHGPRRVGPPRSILAAIGRLYGSEGEELDAGVGTVAGIGPQGWRRAVEVEELAEATAAEGCCVGGFEPLVDPMRGVDAQIGLLAEHRCRHRFEVPPRRHRPLLATAYKRPPAIPSVAARAR